MWRTTDPRDSFLRLLPRVSQGVGDVPDLRLPLYNGSVGATVLLSRSAPNAPPAGHSATSQVILPIAGVFLWSVGGTRQIIDASTALFVSAGDDFGESHPLKDVGHASAVVIPTIPVLDELRSGREPDDADPFVERTRPATARGQMLAHQMLSHPYGGDNFEGDELMIAFVLELARARNPAIPRMPKRIVMKAKEFLHGLGGARLSLDEAAHAVGVSPIYLTQAFKASEGVPLYRYYLNTRLSQALGRLPYCPSITSLALELGFSSHSHFSASFNARYGLPPSEYRDLSRSRQRTFDK